MKWDHNMVILKNYIWARVCDYNSDIICDKCIEIRLGRPICMEDLKPPSIPGVTIIPCNRAWLSKKRKLYRTYIKITYICI